MNPNVVCPLHFQEISTTTPVYKVISFTPVYNIANKKNSDNDFIVQLKGIWPVNPTFLELCLWHGESGHHKLRVGDKEW